MPLHILHVIDQKKTILHDPIFYAHRLSSLFGTATVTGHYKNIFLSYALQALFVTKKIYMQSL
jgi:hypothetical protein